MRKILVILALFPAFWLTGCKEKLVQEVTATWPDGSPQKVTFYSVAGEKKHKVKEIKYYQGGKKELEGEYNGEKKDGAWTTWFENGRKQSEGFFKNDLRDGKAVVWRENGFKYYEGTYSMGKLHGTWILYDTDGSHLKEILYEHDKKVKEIDYKAGVPFTN
jgi:antitoxin component YwqK of YwqJK toxin-antitoxin module